MIRFIILSVIPYCKIWILSSVSLYYAHVYICIYILYPYAGSLFPVYFRYYSNIFPKWMKLSQSRSICFKPSILLFFFRFRKYLEGWKLSIKMLTRINSKFINWYSYINYFYFYFTFFKLLEWFHYSWLYTILMKD